MKLGSRTPRLAAAGPIASALFVLACHSAARPPSAATPDMDELAVWTVVIDSLFGRGRGQFVVLEDSTFRPSSLPGEGDLEDRQPGFPPEAIADLAKKMGSQVSLSAVLGEVPGVHWLTASESRAIFEAHPVAAWTRFYERFPRARSGNSLEALSGRGAPLAGGLGSLSRVGFDRRRMYAAVVADYGCGSTCGRAR